MSAITYLRAEFVDHAPTNLERGVLYVSTPFRTTLHLCCCGCGQEVVLPIRPNRWRLKWDGEDVSLQPSVGNIGLQCRSHYFVDAGKIRWALPLSDLDDYATPATRRRRSIFTAIGDAFRRHR